LASVYSLPAGFFDATEVRQFLAALAEARPKREIIVLSRAGSPVEKGRMAPNPHLYWIAPPAGDFTPWPRDPFLFGWRQDRPALLDRPNVQRGREEDRAMAEALVRAWPRALADRWGAPSLATAAVPFHHGQFLLSESTVWLSIHSLERAVLTRLGVDQVPIDSLRTVAGRHSYLEALETEAARLAESLDGYQPAWVHDLPLAVEPDAFARFAALAGGAGFDLDSYLTVLPVVHGGGAPRALVGSPPLGEREVQRVSAGELEAMRAFYELAPPVQELRQQLVAYQASPRARDLGAYLDGIAEHLTESGLTVTRLPLLLVPTALFEDRAGVDYPDFLLTWNNVVLDNTGGKATAEGFRYHFAPGDRAAVAAFAAAGYRLDLFPALRRSIVLGGGYRCASNHLRAPSDGQRTNSR
jgi:hypothetical protein